MNEKARDDMLAHFRKVFPLEGVGLIVDGDFWPLENTHEQPESNFRIDPREWADLEDRGNIEMLVHSHPNHAATASEADLVMCEESGVPWFIQDIFYDRVGEGLLIHPKGYVAPLVGRTFHHGVLDCLTLILDYYLREKGIDLGHYDREFGWWDQGKDYYRELLPRAGFYPVPTPREGDIVLMQIRGKVPNHAGIYLENGKLTSEPEVLPTPGPVILHHLVDTLSRRDVFGGYWLEKTVGYWRYGNEG